MIHMPNRIHNQGQCQLCIRGIPIIGLAAADMLIFTISIIDINTITDV